MKKIIFIFLLSAGLAGCKVTTTSSPEETVTISGRVTDFDGNPIDSATVSLEGTDFEPLYETYTDKDGYYTLSGVKKGRYIALCLMREKEYPRAHAVPEEDMRLEFWAWNVVADRDLTIDARYHKLELYGTTVFEQIGGYPSMFVYFRPMSVTRHIQYKGSWNKAEMETAGVDLSVLPEYLGVEIFADGEPLEIYSVQAVEEYIGETGHQLGYLAQVARPAKPTDKPYIMFRVVAKNRQYDERGENVYFYEIKNYD